MAIDQPRRHERALQVDDLRARAGRGAHRILADGDDMPAGHADGVGAHVRPAPVHTAALT
jgi:hypothetical protein